MDIVPFLGRALDGARVTARDLRRGTVAEPTWGPRGFLNDLELRLELGPRAVDEVARVFETRARAEALARSERTVFFARSLDVDPWGTAKALLAMRDELVAAGWDGMATAGMPRIEALAALDGRHREGRLPFGEVDRIARIERALAAAPYARVTLAETISDWPGAWRRLFRRLAEVGVEVALGSEPRAAERGAPASDLERVAAAMREGAPRGGRVEVVGDGSFLFLSAETPEPLAEAVAALVMAEQAAHPARTIALLRTAEHGALEAALPRFGLPRLGGLRSSGVPLAGAWLPLVMTLMATPFDAEAALDLLLMPESGLRRREADDLADALQSAPGLGSRWAAALVAIDERGEGRSEGLERALRWVVAPENGIELGEIAERVRLLDRAIAQRVVMHRLPPADDRRTAIGDQASIDALEAARVAMSAWLRALPPEAGRQSPSAAPDRSDARAIDALLRTFGAIAASTLTQQEAGGIERVDDAAALLAPVDTLVWWGFVDPGAPPTSAFRAAEREALERVGVGLESPEALVRRRAAAWRALLGRSQRLVLAVPGRIAGERQAPHPLWAEIRGRLGWDAEEAFAPVVVSAAELALRGTVGAGERALTVPREEAREIRWAEASARWSVPASMTEDGTRRYSVSALETLLKCPLRSVLERRARLRERAVGVIGGMPLVLGNLGHRLVQVLFETGRLGSAALAAMDLARFVEDTMREEAAILFAPGRRVERKDTARQLAEALKKAVAWLEAEGLTAVSVEEQVQPVCGSRTLDGRLDLRASDAGGEQVIADFKWSTRKHAAALDAERAVQLAAYAAAFRRDGGSPRGAYLGLRDGAVVPADAARLARIWARIEATMAPLEAALERGEVLVTGTGDGLDLGGALGVPAGIAFDPKAICDFCRFGLICGRDASGAAPDEGDDDAA